VVLLKKPGVVTTTSFFAVLLVAELGARILSGDLQTESGTWASGEAALKAAQMTETYNRGETVDVVFVGDSMTAGVIDPIIFTRASGVSSYNAAFAGPAVRTTTLWTLDIVEPLLSPQVVVLGVQTRSVNDNTRSSKWRHRMFVQSPGYKQATSSLAARVEGALEDISYFMRYRRALRHPNAVLTTLDDENGDRQKKSKKPIGPRGVRLDEPRTYSARTDLMQGFRRDVGHFSWGEIEYEALKKLSAELRARGVRLIILSLPVTADYKAAHRRPKETMDKYHAALGTFVDEEGVTLIDAENAFPTSDPFRDPLHLDVEGRRAVARALAHEWDKVLGSRGEIVRLECVALSCRLSR
jgi:hypothetical protein